MNIKGRIQKRLRMGDGSEVLLIDRLGAPADMPLEAINRNVFRLDSFGKMMWQIGAPLGLRDRTPYTNIYEEPEGVLKAYCWDGVEYIVDLGTGKVKAGDFLK